MIIFLCSLVSVFIILALVWNLISKIREKKTRTFCIEKYESYLVIFEHFCKKAYDIIYKDRMLIYSIEAMAVDKIQYDAISKQFCSLALRLLGPNLVKEFSDFFGDDTTLIFNMMEFFNNQYENDKIKETATEDLMEKEVDIGPVGEVIK